MSNHATRYSATLIAAAALAATCLYTTHARAQDPFRLRAESTSGTPQTATAVGSDLIELVENLVDSQEAFTPLAGQDVSASLTYGGVADAVLVSRSAAGTSATLTLPTTGFTRTFTGATADDVQDQIEDFLLKEGAAEYAKFLRTINEQSVLGVVDGNPLAGTALLSSDTFNRFGLYRGGMAPVGNVIRGGGGTGVNLEGGTAETDVCDGYYANVSFAGLLRFGDRVGLSLGPTLTYREVEDAEVYHVGGHVALPIVLVMPGDDEHGIVWQVTPAFLSGASGAVDLAAGGTLLGGGVTSSITIPLGDRFAVDIANQISFFEGYSISIGEYDFETDLSQQLLKNGVRLSFALSDAIYVDGSFTHSKYLEDAAVEDWISPGAGIGLHFGDTSGVRFGYQANLADDIDTHAGQVQLYFNY